MKTKISIFTLLVILIIILGTSCEKEDPITIPVTTGKLPVVTNNPHVTETYNVMVTVSNGGTVDPAVGITNVKAGDSVSYEIMPDSGYSIYSIKVDNEDVTISNRLKLESILSNKNIEIKFILNDVLRLVSRPRFFKGIETYRDGVFYDSINFKDYPEVFTDKYCFYLKGTFIGKEYDYFRDGVGIYEIIGINGNLVGNGKWSLSGENIKIGDFIYRIVKLDEDGNFIYDGLTDNPKNFERYTYRAN